MSVDAVIFLFTVTHHLIGEPTLFRRYCDSDGNEVDDDDRVIGTNGKVQDNDGNMLPANRNSLMQATEYRILYSTEKMKQIPNRLSLILNIDGATLKNKSKIAVTPISFTVAELGLTSRLMRKNTMMIAAAVSRHKVDYQQLWQIGFWKQFE